MAVNVPNSSLYQQQLSDHAVAFREALDDLLHDASYLTSMGGATFLTAAVPNGIGLSSPDATLIMNTIGAVVPANATVQALQAWIDSTRQLWGGR